MAGADNAELAATHNAEISGRGLHCAWQSPAFDGLRPVSASHYPADVQQCAVLDGDQDNARPIGTEFVVTEKIFRLLPGDEKLLWHSHTVEAERGPLSSSGAQEVAGTYGRVVRSLEGTENLLPPALSQLLTSSSDPVGSEKSEVSVPEDEANSPESTRASAEGTRPGAKQAGTVGANASDDLEFDIENDKYLNDAVHRPVVNHRSSHLPALTDRLPNDGTFLVDTRSSEF